MKISFSLQIGQTVFNVEDEAATPTDFFELVSFWHSLPQAGPNGESDLYLCFREPQGYKYYSIICPSAKAEFELGQLKEEKGGLFPKGWQPMHPDAVAAWQKRHSLSGNGAARAAEKCEATAAMLTREQHDAIGEIWQSLLRLKRFASKDAIQAHLKQHTGKTGRDELTFDGAASYITKLRSEERSAEVDLKAKSQEAR